MPNSGSTVSLASLQAQTAAPAPELKITGAVSSPLTLTQADLKKLPRKTLTVVNPHDKKSEVYEGVPLEELLRRAGVVQGEKLKGPALAMYVVAEAEDGFAWFSHWPNWTLAFWIRTYLWRIPWMAQTFRPRKGPSGL